jgi:hypothetical protein
MIISNTGEGATKVRVIGGWGDRICTLVVAATPTLLLTPMVMIFKGQGNIKREELAFYESLPNIKILFQENAWVDGPTEIKILRLMIKPEVDRLEKKFTEEGKIFPGYLLVQDNFSAHSHAYSFLNLLPTLH